jgi:8-oxo-dGTP diphosphatase
VSVLYLVRHAKAGDRRDWAGDDTARPLSASGERQAQALAERLSWLATGALVSSPYLRCRQTLVPLAERLGTTVQTDRRLAEDQGFVGAVQLLGELPHGSVLCSHGDVIPETIQALQRRGCHILGEPDWRKASTWVIQRDDHDAFVEAEVWPPPEA